LFVGIRVEDRRVGVNPPTLGAKELKDEHVAIVSVSLHSCSPGRGEINIRVGVGESLLKELYCGEKRGVGKELRVVYYHRFTVEEALGEIRRGRISRGLVLLKGWVSRGLVVG